MPELTLEDVGDTLGGKILLRTTAFGDIGIASIKDRKVQQAVYWKAVDTDKVIDAMVKLRGLI
jgi:hypothetical protein